MIVGILVVIAIAVIVVIATSKPFPPVDQWADEIKEESKRDRLR